MNYYTVKFFFKSCIELPGIGSYSINADINFAGHNSLGFRLVKSYNVCIIIMKKKGLID